LLIILFVSFFACSFPLIASRFPWIRIPRGFFFAIRHFGTGVLLSTAFVHLLPTAFILLGNQCLSSFWVDDYPAMPGAIALAGIFFVTIIEMVFQPARHMSNVAVQGQRGSNSSQPVVHRQESGVAQDESQDEDEIALPMEMGRLHGTSTSLSRQLSRLSRRDDIVQERDTLEENPARTSKLAADVLANEDGRMGFGHSLTPAQQHQKDILQCMMLEVGILFHSVFIGMTLSVTVGQEFVILLIAIAFHRMAASFPPTYATQSSICLDANLLFFSLK
jgi:solute carrier family 39 (zinc transporter), member 1/2/3